MAGVGNPWIGTDFSMEQQPQGPPAAPPAGPPGPPDTGDIFDSTEQLRKAQEKLNALMGSPQYEVTTFNNQEIKTGKLDPGYEKAIAQAETEATFWRNRRLAEIDREQAQARQDMQIAQQRDDAASARANSAYLRQLDQEAARIRDEENRGFQQEERIAGQEFDLEKLGKTQEFQGQLLEKGHELDLERQRQQQGFDAEQKQADRMLRQLEIDIAAGNLNATAALGVLQKWLEGQQYTLPSGAEYVPGFQPGGAVQEASRLAGVGYNPANYKANTVPFDPAAVVRQTMGR